jgi:hypothetical protein
MTQSFLRRPIAILMAVLLAAPLSLAAQQPAPAQQPQSPSSAPAATQQDAPALETRPQSGTTQAPDQQPANSNKPVGTATAPYEKATGIAASRPAGAVIAPAKQRRARTFFIRIGIVVGAAAAIGAVAALSHSSPSQPH